MEDLVCVPVRRGHPAVSGRDDPVCDDAGCVREEDLELVPGLRGFFCIRCICATRLRGRLVRFRRLFEPHFDEELQAGRTREPRQREAREGRAVTEGDAAPGRPLPLGSKQVVSPQLASRVDAAAGTHVARQSDVLLPPLVVLLQPDPLFPGPMRVCEVGAAFLEQVFVRERFLEIVACNRNVDQSRHVDHPRARPVDVSTDVDVEHHRTFEVEGVHQVIEVVDAQLDGRRTDRRVNREPEHVPDLRHHERGRQRDHDRSTRRAGTRVGKTRVAARPVAQFACARRREHGDRNCEEGEPAESVHPVASRSDCERERDQRHAPAQRERSAARLSQRPEGRDEREPDQQYHADWLPLRCFGEHSRAHEPCTRVEGGQSPEFERSGQQQERGGDCGREPAAAACGSEQTDQVQREQVALAEARPG